MINFGVNRQIELIQLAMEQANLAILSGNSPFGALLTDIEGNVIFKAYNTVNSDTDPTAHAEINLIKEACKQLKTNDLSGYCLISNAQSCPMCFSAAIKAKIQHFIFGYAENETLNPQIDVFTLNEYVLPPTQIISGVLKDECETQIKKYRHKAK